MEVPADSRSRRPGDQEPEFAQPRPPTRRGLDLQAGVLTEPGRGPARRRGDGRGWLTEIGHLRYRCATAAKAALGSHSMSG